MVRRSRRGKMLRSKDQLEGLAQEWEQVDEIRRSVLWNNCMLLWPNEDSVGVASFRAAKMNYQVLKPLFVAWTRCSLAKPRGVSLEAIQPQVPQPTQLANL